MSALDRVPTNQNLLYPQNYRLFIKRAPNLNFNVQKVVLPGVSMDVVEEHNPFTKIPLPGDHINFDTFELTFKVDEDMKSYLEMLDWFFSLGFPTTYEEYLNQSNRTKTDLTGRFSDIQLLILTNAKNPNVEVNLLDAHPVNITPLAFDYTDDDPVTTDCTVSFKYSTFFVKSAKNG